MAKESTFKNMTLTLFVVSFVSATALGLVFEVTKKPKSEAEKTKKNFAIRKVVPEFDNDPNAQIYTIPTTDGTAILNCYPAYKNGQLVGTAIESYTNRGYSGLIRIMVGLTPDGTVVNTSVLEQKETPGLGTKMTEPLFKDQFLNKNPGTSNLKVKQDGGEIDAITASTITSRAYCEAIQRAYEAYMKGGKK